MISIIVATRHGGRNLEKCLDSILSQDYPQDKLEVIVVGDSPNFSTRGDVKVMGLNAKPGAKRNAGARESMGEILAFCDDDAVVSKDWLKNLITHLINPEVAAVGGPNLTPPHAGLRERCSGYIFSSFVGSAAMTSRYLPNGSPAREADETDLIACNMALRKSVLEEVGGFPRELWPNEENVLCHLLKEAGYKLIYTPEAIVWHQRRPVLIQHTKQTFSYGQGRGKMSRMYPSSIKKIHLLPPVFLLLLIVGGILSLIGIRLVRATYVIIMLIYFVTLVGESLRISIKNRDLFSLFLLPPAFFLHHCAYGLGFLRGFFYDRAPTKAT